MNDSLSLLFRYVSVLLDYPAEGWREAAAQIRSRLSVLDAELPDMTGSIRGFMDAAEALGEQLEEKYVQTFDFGKKTNLYMTYAKFGEERERGPALLHLKQIYEQAGFDLASSELTDYLPLILEFVSAAPMKDAVEMMSSMRKRLEEIRQELRDAGSLYAGLFDALTAGGLLQEQRQQALAGERG